MALKKIKISQLDEETNYTGSYTIGTNASNVSKKFSLGFIEGATTGIGSAISAANAAAILAGEAAEAAATAAELANQAAEDANEIIEDFTPEQIQEWTDALKWSLQNWGTAGAEKLKFFKGNSMPSAVVGNDGLWYVKTTGVNYQSYIVNAGVIYKLDAVTLAEMESAILLALATKADLVHSHIISDVTGLQIALDVKIPLTQKAAALGVATLDSNIKVPLAQLPDAIFSVQEYGNFSLFPLSGQPNTIYIDKSNGNIFRYGGGGYEPLNLPEIEEFAEFFVRYDISQSLTNGQKIIARTNIAAAADDAVVKLDGTQNIGGIKGFVQAPSADTDAIVGTQLVRLSQVQGLITANKLKWSTQEWDVLGAESIKLFQVTDTTIETTDGIYFEKKDTKSEFEIYLRNDGTKIKLKSDLPPIGANVNKFLKSQSGETSIWAALDLADVTGLVTALAGKEPTISKGSFVQGTGTTLTGTLANRLIGTGNLTIALNTTYSDARYLRKDANDTNSTFTLTVGKLSGGVIMAGTATDNGVDNLQVIGSILQTSVKSALLKANSDGRLVAVVNGDTDTLITKADLIQGTGATLTGTLTNRILGTGNVTIALNTTYSDARYLRKDANDNNSTFNLTLGTLQSGVILVNTATNNGFDKLQVEGSILQTSVKSKMLKADATGRLVGAVDGTDYISPTTNITNYVTTNTNQTSLSGTKEWVSEHTFSFSSGKLKTGGYGTNLDLTGITGGWARSYSITTDGAATTNGFGASGTGSTLSYFYVTGINHSTSTNIRVYTDGTTHPTVGTNTIWHAGNHIHRTDLQNDARYLQIANLGSYVTTNTDQLTGLSGKKTWTAEHVFMDKILVNTGTSVGTDKLQVNGSGSIDGIRVHSTGHIYNIFIGNTSSTDVTGQNNTSIGYGSQSNTTTGINNTSLGTFTLNRVTSGNDNIGLGPQALFYNTTGGSNIGIGSNALFNSLTTTGSIGVGRDSLFTATGTRNLAIGYYSGKQVTTGSYNVLIGSNEGSRIATLSNWMIFSDGAGTERFSVSSTGKMTIGTYSDDVHKLRIVAGSTTSNALYTDGYITTSSIATGSIVKIDGSGRLVAATAGTDFITSATNITNYVTTNTNQTSLSGTKSWTAAHTFGDYVYIGASPSSSTDILQVTGSANIAGIRIHATGAISNTFVGFQVSESSTGSSSTGVGYQALKSNTTGYSNNAFGATTLYNNTIGVNNNAFGSAALYNNTIGSYNVGMGYATLYTNTTGGSNTALGYQAQRLGTGSNNTAVGYNSLYNGTGNNNSVFGTNAGFNITTGSNNVVLGGNTASRIATLSNWMLFSDGAGNERFAVDNSGNMTVGVYSATTYKLFVQGGSDSADGLDIRGKIRQSSVKSSLIKADASGVLVAATGSDVGSFDIADSGGTTKFSVAISEKLRFEGSGDTSVSYDNATKKVIISSTAGSGGTGSLTSFNGRTANAVIPTAGDYNTSMVTENSGYKYFTEARVLATVLTGYTIGLNNAISATDTILEAFGKIQGQITTGFANKSNWDTAYSNTHTHSNKAILDAIDSDAITNWNTAYTNNHTHANKSDLDTITGTMISNWNAAHGWGNHAGLYRPIAWVPAWGDVTGKPGTFAPAAHTHLWADITDKPGTFAPAAHTHLWADITDKPTTISGYGITDFNTLGDARWSLLAHNHTGVYEPVFSKNTGFNKNFGTTEGTVSEGNHNHATLYYPLSTNPSGYLKVADLPINHITTNTDQSGLTGIKTWTNKQIFSSKILIASGIDNGVDALQVNGSGIFNKLRIHSTGDDFTNTFIGRNTAPSNTGTDNVAIGVSALNSNTIGSENTAIGSLSLASNTQGMSNTAIGSFSLNTQTTGIANTGIGSYSLFGLTTGNFNIGVGNNSGADITTGSYNVVIGSNYGSRIATLSNYMIFSDGAGNERFSVTPTGRMLINTVTDNTLDQLQVNGGIKQTSVTSNMIKADATGRLIAAVAGTDYIQTETDPIFVGHVAYGITGTNISNWNLAFGWGNHATFGYLTSASLTNYVNTTGNQTGILGNKTWSGVHSFAISSGKLVTGGNGLQIDLSGITGGWARSYSIDTSGSTSLNGFGALGTDSDISYFYMTGITFNTSTNIRVYTNGTTNPTVGNNTIWHAGNHIHRTDAENDLRYIQTETDPIFVGHVAYGITGTNISNWNLAFGWGNHSTQGYLKAADISNKADKATQIISGTGLSGGGTLAADRTLSVLYGTTSGTAAQGNDSRILNGQTAFGWGDHSTQGYLKTASLSNYVTTNTNQLTGLSGKKTWTAEHVFMDKILVNTETSVGTDKLQVNGSANIQGIRIHSTGHTNNILIGLATSTVVTGQNNTSIGYGSQSNTTTGINNTSLGTFTLNRVTSGNDNVGLGSQSLYYNTTGSNNIGIGTNALFNSLTTTGSVAVGRDSLFVATGTRNLAIGYYSGKQVTTGSYNVLIGSNEGSRIATLSNWMIFSDGAGNERFAVDNSGNMTVGVYSATTYKLFVQGGSDSADGLDIRGKIRQSSVKSSLIKADASGVLVAATGSDINLIETDPTVPSHVKAITTTDIAHWNTAYTNNHTHSNKGILDATQEAFTTVLKNKLDSLTGYTLPTASAGVLGGIKVGSNLTIASGVLSATAYTSSTSVTVSSYNIQRAALTGDVTAAANSNSLSIAAGAVSFAKFQNVSSGTILGRYSGGAGSVQSISLESYFKLNSSTLGINLTTNRIAFGTGNQFSESAKLQFIDRYIYVGNGSASAAITAGGEGSGSNAFLKSENGNLLLQTPNGGSNTVVVQSPYFRVENLAGTGGRYVMANDGGTLYASTGSLVPELTNEHIAFGSGANVLTSSSNFKYVYGRYIQMSNGLNAGWADEGVGRIGFIEAPSTELWLQSNSSYKVVVQRGGFKVNSMAGASTRMVTVNYEGTFETQAIPSGGGSVSLPNEYIAFGIGGVLGSSPDFTFTRNTGFASYYITITNNWSGKVAIGAFEGKGFVQSTTGELWLQASDGSNIVAKNSIQTDKHCYFEGGATFRSDARVKSEFKVVGNALEKIRKVNGYSYLFNGKMSNGVTAQEMLTIMPNLVELGSDNLYNVDYNGIHALTLQGIKEIDSEVEQLKKRVLYLENKLGYAASTVN